MKRIVAAAGLALLMALCAGEPAGAYEDISYEDYQVIGFPCGYLQMSNEASQYGVYNWIQYTITTTG